MCVYPPPMHFNRSLADLNVPVVRSPKDARRSRPVYVKEDSFGRSARRRRLSRFMALLWLGGYERSGE